MEYQFKSYSRGNKSKIISVYWGVVLVVIWIAFMYWSIILGHRTVMFEWFPQWTISIAFAAIVSVIGGTWSILRCPLKSAFKNFLWSGFAGFMLIVPVFDVLTYLLTNKTIRYQTEYEITSPGPTTSRFSRCDHGIWIKETYTERWKLLCISNPKSKTQTNTGTVWVTAKTGPIGAYVADYQFSPPNSKQ
ncbi:hypothetical protein J7S87_00940 [Providencia rettgeri]|nr:hypothetical protein [Providencia rettgeri]QPN88273.1 hypothetical protein IM703_10520 [Proteus vulgaris]